MDCKVSKILHRVYRQCQNMAYLHILIQSYYKPSLCYLRIKLLPSVQRTYSSVNIFGAKNIYLVALLAIAFSCFYCIGYLYCITFFTIIVNNDILQRALQSVTKNCKLKLIVSGITQEYSWSYYVCLYFREIIAVGGYPLADYSLCICYCKLCFLENWDSRIWEHVLRNNWSVLCQYSPIWPHWQFPGMRISDAPPTHHCLYFIIYIGNWCWQSFWSQESVLFWCFLLYCCHYYWTKHCVWYYCWHFFWTQGCKGEKASELAVCVITPPILT